MESAVEMVGSIRQLGKAVLSTSSWVSLISNNKRIPTNFLRRRVCHRLLQNFRIFWRSCRRNKSRKLGRIWSFGFTSFVSRKTELSRYYSRISGPMDSLTLTLMIHRAIARASTHSSVPREKYSTALFHLQSSDTI